MSKKRYYFIADNYRYHILTEDASLYRESLFDYFALLTRSQKTNSYSFGTVELYQVDFDRYFKETNLAGKPLDPPKADTPKNHLRLVEG